ncbi:hypothetical protein evm_001311 [Chilo suppressalis]|nr:hypothetical protein evm_001311 [Chilo suppressalis]
MINAIRQDSEDISHRIKSARVVVLLSFCTISLRESNMADMDDKALSLVIARFSAKFLNSFYTCSLWVDYTQRAYSDLRVQYNNAFRVLMGLPRFCSASGMFAESQIDGFHAIMRKRCASMLGRLRASSNGILRTLAARWDSPMLKRWVHLHALHP